MSGFEQPTSPDLQNCSERKSFWTRKIIHPDDIVLPPFTEKERTYPSWDMHSECICCPGTIFTLKRKTVKSFSKGAARRERVCSAGRKSSHVSHVFQHKNCPPSVVSQHLCGLVFNVSHLEPQKKTSPAAPTMTRLYWWTFFII